MKKLLKSLLIYGFTLPIVLDLLGVIFKPDRMTYITKYPLSFILEQFTRGILLVIPYIILMLLVYNNLLNKSKKDQHYHAHKYATIITTISLILLTTLGVVILFMSNFLGFTNKIFISIAFYSIFPVNSALFVLLIYGLGLLIGRFFKNRLIQSRK